MAVTWLIAQKSFVKRKNENSYKSLEYLTFSLSQHDAMCRSGASTPNAATHPTTSLVHRNERTLRSGRRNFDAESWNLLWSAPCRGSDTR
jgi:hypothetical protein